MNNQEQDANQKKTADHAPHLSKDEMRQKIKASLAAGSAPGMNASYPSEQPSLQPEKPRSSTAPVHKQPAAASQPTAAAAGGQSRADKARQIREAMSAQRGESYGAPVRTGQTGAKRQTSAAEPPKPRMQPPVNRPEAPQKSGRTSLEFYPDDHLAKASSQSMARTLLIIGIAVLAVILIVYIGGLAVYHGKFLPRTYVNGISLSGMTGEEAQAAILKTAQEQSVTFVQKDGEKVVFKGTSFGCTASLPAGALDEAANERHGLWFTKLFTKSDYDVQLIESYSEADLSSLIAAYDWGNVAPTNAEIVKNEDGSFSIQPEDDGNMVDTKVLSDYAISEMRFGNNVISMADSGCYKKAEVRSEDLQETLAMYEKIGRIEITYDMTDRQEKIDPVGTETIDNETLMDWINTDSGKLALDTDKAYAWIKEHIADKYDTLVTGYTAPFASTLDGTIDMPIGGDGIYGWKTNIDETVKKLEEHIQEGEPMTIEPVYKVEGFRKGENSGDTYIEVDICNQKLFYYVNGELYLETDCVTGLASDPSRVTPPGRYKVWSRESPRYLGTMEVQGYRTLVQYWMPVTYTGIGLHDLNRSAYGGTIYQTNGSHGCINLPLDIAAQLYNKVAIGTPVIIIP